MILNARFIDVLLQQEQSLLGAVTGTLHRSKAIVLSVKPSVVETKRLGMNRRSFSVSRDHVEHTFSMTKELRLGALDLALFQAVFHSSVAGNVYTFTPRVLENVPTLSLWVKASGVLYRLSGVVIERLVVPVRPREVLILEIQGRAASCIVGGAAGAATDEPNGSLSHRDTTLVAPESVLTDANLVIECPRQFVREPSVARVLSADVKITGNYSNRIQSVNSHTLLAQVTPETLQIGIEKNGRAFQAVLTGPVWGDEPSKVNGDLVRQVNIEPSSWSLSLTT